jgi:hypothetical protein
MTNQKIGATTTVVDDRQHGSDDQSITSLHRLGGGRLGVVEDPHRRRFVKIRQFGEDFGFEVETLVETHLLLIVDREQSQTVVVRVPIVDLTVRTTDRETRSGDVARAR